LKSRDWGRTRAINCIYRKKEFLLEIGSEELVTATKERLGFRAIGREVFGKDCSFELKEPSAVYKGILGHENAALRPQNQYFWEDIRFITT